MADELIIPDFSEDDFSSELNIPSFSDEDFTSTPALSRRDTLVEPELSSADFTAPEDPSLFKVGLGEFLRTLDINFDLEDARSDIQVPRSADPGLAEDVASGLGQAVADVTTAGSTSLAGAGLGALLRRPGLGARGGLLAGSALTIVQGFRRQMNEIEDEVKALGGDDADVVEAQERAAGFVVAGESLDLVKIGLFTRLLPKSLRRRLSGKLTDKVTDEAAEAASESVGKIAKVRSIITRGLQNFAIGATSEGVGEFIQETGASAGVQSAVKDSGLFEEVKEAAVSPRSGRAFAVGFLTGGIARTTISPVVEAIFTDPASRTPEDTSAIEVVDAIDDVSNPETKTNRVEIELPNEIPQEFAVEAVKSVNEKGVTARPVEGAENKIEIINQEFKNQEADQRIQEQESQRQESISKNTEEQNLLRSEIDILDTEIKEVRAQEIDPANQEALDQRAETLRGLQLQRGEMVTKIGELENTQLELTAPDRSPEQEANLQIDKVASNIGISAARASEFKVSKFGEQVIAKDILNPQAQEEFIRSGLPTHRLVSNKENIQAAENRIEQFGDVEAAANAFINRTADTPVMGNLRGDEVGFTAAALYNRLDADRKSAAAAGDIELATQLGQQRALIQSEIFQSTSPAATEAGRTLQAFGVIEQQLANDGAGALEYVTRAFNQGREPISQKVALLEDPVQKSQLEIEALEIRSDTLTSDIEADQQIIDRKEKESSTIEKQIEGLETQLQEAKTESEGITDSQFSDTASEADVQKVVSQLARIKDLQKELSALRKKADEDAVVLPERVQALEDRLASKRKERASLKGQETRASRQLTEEQIQSRKDKLVDVEEDILEIKNELDLLRTQIEKDPRLSALRDRSRALSKERSKLTQAINRLPSRDQLVAQQKARAIALEDRVIELDDELALRKKRLEKLRAIIEKRNAPLKEKVAGLNKVARSIQDKRKRLLEQEARLFDARNKARAQITPSVLPSEIVARLKPLQEQYERAVDVDSDLLKGRAMAEMLQEVALASNPTAMEMAQSIWYINVLSGITTQEANLVSAGLNTSLRLVSAAVASPKSTNAMISGMLEGAKRGYTDAKQVMRNLGNSDTLAKLNVADSAFTLLNADPEKLNSSQQRRQKVIQAATLRLSKFGVGDVMLRLLSAGDLFLSRTAQEARAALLADRMVRESKSLNEDTAYTNIAEVLHNSSENYNAAYKQAIDELAIVEPDLEGDVLASTATQRAFEIIDSQRPQALVDEAKLFGKISTFTNPPEGRIGQLAALTNRVIKAQEYQTPFGPVQPLRAFVPFVNIIGNVANAGLDYTPLGLVRASSPTQLVGLDGKREKSLLERKEEAVRSIIGASTTAGLFALADSFSDDDEPYFAIYGDGGKLSFDRRAVLREQGWKPNSIKIGPAYMPFNETPLVFAFAPIGAFFDAKRWDKKFDERTWLDNMSLAASGTLRSFSDTGFLTGIKELTDFLGGDERDVGSFARAFSKRMKNFGTGFVPAKGFMKSLTQLGEQDVVDTQRDLFSYYIASWPVANKLDTQPALNIFGETLTDDRLFIGSRYYQETRKDPNYRFLASKNLTINPWPKAHRIKVSISGPNKKQKAAISSIKAERAKEFEEISDWKKYFGRLSYDTFSHQERYELQQILGPKIKAIVEDLRENFSDLPRKEIQQILDKEVKKAKRDSKIEFLKLPPSGRSNRRSTDLGL